MDENCEGGNANNEENSLSQSYFESIQKVTGNDRASLLDFEIPAHVLEKRKAEWNALFEKYSSIVCEEQEEDEMEFPESQKEEEVKEFSEPTKEKEVMEFPEPAKEEECTTKNNQRPPMRKPMSMVQYWVNTGNQPYVINNSTKSKSQSDSGSSLAEECLKTPESINAFCQMTSDSLEKNHESNSGNIHLRLASSSGSSVDTVPYILANNNTTKKADTIAIMEGSKIVHKEESNPLKDINGLEKNSQHKKGVSFLNNMLYNLKSTKLDVNISNNISKNKETVNNVNKNLKSNSQNQDDCINNSDESIFKSIYDFHILTQNSVEQNNDINQSLNTSVIGNKTLKRKKLYNKTDSPAEFTPVSEDNASQLTLRMPVKKCKHPALETPRVSSRPSYFVRYQRLKLKSKRRTRISQSFKMLQSQKNGESNNSQNLHQDNPQTINEVEENCDQNLKKLVDSSNSIKIQEQSRKNINSLTVSLLNDSKKEMLDLKPVVISLQRLPHKYNSVEIRSQEKGVDSLNLNKSNVITNCTESSSKCLLSKTSQSFETKIDNFKNLISTGSPNLSSNNESNTTDCKSPSTKPHGFLSQIQKSCSKKCMSYVIAFSSDDETELSILNLKEKMKKRISSSKDTAETKNPLDVKSFSEKELLDSNSRVDDTNKIRIPDTNKTETEKKHELKRKSDKLTKLEISGKNRKTDMNCKSTHLENDNKSNFKKFSLFKHMSKRFSLMSSDDESVIFEPTDCSAPNRFLEKSKGNLSPGNKALKENFDHQTAINTLPIKEKQKSSSNKKKSVLEKKSTPRKKLTVARNLRYSRNFSSSSDDELLLPLKHNYSCKPKLISSAIKDNTDKPSSIPAEEVANTIGEIPANSVSLKKNESKINHLEERINKMKMKNQSTIIPYDSNHLKTVTQILLKVDSSEEENFVEIFSKRNC